MFATILVVAACLLFFLVLDVDVKYLLPKIPAEMKLRFSIFGIVFILLSVLLLYPELIIGNFNIKDYDIPSQEFSESFEEWTKQKRIVEISCFVVLIIVEGFCGGRRFGA